MIDLSVAMHGWMNMAAAGCVAASGILAVVCAICNCCGASQAKSVNREADCALPMSSCGEATIAQVMTGWGRP